MELVVREPLAHGGLIQGFNESKTLIKKQTACLCLLAEDTDQPGHVKLVKALCPDHYVEIMLVDSAKKIVEWCGLCKINIEGKAKNVVGCSCAVIKDNGEEPEGLSIVQAYLKSCRVLADGS